MAQALNLGGNQENPMKVGDSRSQEAYLLPKSNGPLQDRCSCQGKGDASIWRHMLCAVPTAPRITSQNMWPKIKKVTAGLQHHHLLSQLGRQATKSYLVNIKIPKIHTSASFTVCDGDRTVPKESKALERKHLARKERGKRRGSWKENIRGITQGRIW